MNMYPDEDFIGDFDEAKVDRQFDTGTNNIASVPAQPAEAFDDTVIFPEQVLSQVNRPSFQYPALPMIKSPVVVKSTSLIGPLGWGIIAGVVVLAILSHKKRRAS